VVYTQGILDSAQILADFRWELDRMAKSVAGIERARAVAAVVADPANRQI
jgi:hypothetical protein